MGSALLVAFLLSACVGLRTEGEKRARRDQAMVGQEFRPDGERPALPVLAPDAALQDYLLFAALNQPRVEAAYFDWAASVRRITVERSLPDPWLTFSTDIVETVMTLMPGLMMEFPGPGKLRLAAIAATAGSEAKYFVFENAILETALALKTSYYELYFLDERIRVNREMLELVEEIEQLASIQNGVGRVTLQDVLRAQIEQERIATEISNLEDSRNPLQAQFKAALGSIDEDAPTPLPQKFESTPLDLTPDALWAAARARNPRLKAMEAEVRRADALIRLAYKARIPDFSAGIAVDVKTSPNLVNPRLGVALPIWRDKIAEQIAAAQADKRASEARFSAEEIELAVEFAERSFMFRQATRNLELLTERLLPKAQQSIEVAQSSYVTGKVDFLSLLDAERTLLSFRLSEIEARVQRELALAELSLMILGTPPKGAPGLPRETRLENEGG